jgi:hypothetical protein
MSRRINFSRRGELIVGQSNLSTSHNQRGAEVDFQGSNENAPGLENMRLLPTSSAQDKYSTFMSSLGSTKESILSSSGFGQASNVPFDKGYGYGTNHAGLGRNLGMKTSIYHERDSHGDRGSPADFPGRACPPQTKASEANTAYAPYYRPSRQTSLTEQRLLPSSLGGLDADFSDFKGRSYTGSYQQNDQAIQGQPQYAFPAKYKFDVNNYDNFRRPSVESHFSKEGELGGLSSLAQGGIASAFRVGNQDIKELLSSKNENKMGVSAHALQKATIEDLLGDPKPLKPMASQPVEEPVVEPEMLKVDQIMETPICPNPAQPTVPMISDKPVELYQCMEGCERMFSKDALQHHEKICKKIFQSKRKLFDSKMKRLTQPKQAAEASQLSKPVPSKDAGQGAVKARNWEKQSSQLRKELQNAKGKRPGAAIAKLPKKTDSKVDGNIKGFKK